jgi:methionine synthase I (cobalamin-dependent)
MWGSDLLSSDPSVIGNVHNGFASAGADIIETAT